MEKPKRKAVNVNVREEIDRMAEAFIGPLGLGKKTKKTVKLAFIEGAREGFNLGRASYDQLLKLSGKGAEKAEGPELLQQ